MYTICKTDVHHVYAICTPYSHQSITRCPGLCQSSVADCGCCRSEMACGPATGHGGVTAITNCFTMACAMPVEISQLDSLPRLLAGVAHKVYAVEVEHGLAEAGAVKSFGRVAAPQVGPADELPGRALDVLGCGLPRRFPRVVVCG